MSKHQHHRAAKAMPATMKPVISAQAANTADHQVPKVYPTEIELCAYRKWEHAGKPSGDGVQFWLEAERELAGHR